MTQPWAEINANELLLYASAAAMLVRPLNVRVAPSPSAAAYFIVGAEIDAEWILSGEWMIVQLRCDCIPMNFWALSNKKK